MRLTVALITAALAASSASAVPARRVYTLSDAFFSEDMEEPSLASTSTSTSEGEDDSLPAAFPLEGAPEVYGDAEDSSAGSSFSPVSALLGKLGFSPDHPAKAVLSFGQLEEMIKSELEFEAEPEIGFEVAFTEPEPEASQPLIHTSTSVFEEWKSHIEEMLREASENAEDSVVVLNDENEEEIAAVSSSSTSNDDGDDELNDVKWWRVVAGGRWEVKDGSGYWRAPKHGEKPPMGKPVPKPTRLQAQEAEEEDRLDRLPHPHHHHQHHQHAQQTEEDEHAHYHSHRHGHKRACTFSARLRRVIRNLQPFEAAAFALVIGAGLGAIAHTIFMFFLLSFRQLRSSKSASLSLPRREKSKAGPIRLGEEVVPAYEVREKA